MNECLRSLMRKKINDYVIKKVAVCNYDEWVNYKWEKIFGSKLWMRILK